jgi:antitoxin MazE
MRAAISKWGNSLALRLPKSLAEDAGLSEGTMVDLHLDGDRLVIAPSRPKYRLAELLAEHKQGHRHEETDWGKAEGEEVW